MVRQHRPRDEADHQANMNQARHEPVPASREDDRPQAAAQRSEDIQRDVELGRRRPVRDDRRPALSALAEEEPSRTPAPARPGAAAEDLMGGPAPQGPVPDAPGVQVAAVDSADGRASRIRSVSNAVPGKPDGEVDTRS
jgi:hypothetical protein